MKLRRNQQGNIIFNTVLVVALFSLAYVWYANQPETSSIQPVTEESSNDTVVQEDETMEDESTLDAVTGEVINTIQNLGTTQNNPQKNNSVPAPKNSIILTETETGSFVTIGYANLTQPGYIAVYKVDSNGKTSEIAHSDLLQAKIITNLKLETNTIIAEDQTIVAVLHQDDGDGVFEFPESDPYLKDINGIIVSDVDIVDVRLEREAKGLQDKINTYLEKNY